MTKTKKTGAIPDDKLYFRIGEAAEIVNVKPHVLRYWETEFPQLRPEKSRMGQRVYARSEVELCLLISLLLHERRYTIEGARKVLAKLKGNWAKGLDAVQSGASLPGDDKPSDTGRLDQLRKENAALQKQLEKANEEIASLKARVSKLNKEIVTYRQLQSGFYDALRTELTALASAADKDVTSTIRPNLDGDPK